MPTRSRLRTAPVAWSTSSTANADSTATTSAAAGTPRTEDREHPGAEVEQGLRSTGANPRRVVANWLANSTELDASVVEVVERLEPTTGPPPRVTHPLAGTYAGTGLALHVLLPRAQTRSARIRISSAFKPTRGVFLAETRFSRVMAPPASSIDRVLIPPVVKKQPPHPGVGWQLCPRVAFTGPLLADPAAQVPSDLVDCPRGELVLSQAETVSIPCRSASATGASGASGSPPREAAACGGCMRPRSTGRAHPTYVPPPTVRGCHDTSAGSAGAVHEPHQEVVELADDRRRLNRGLATTLVPLVAHDGPPRLRSEDGEREERKRKRIGSQRTGFVQLALGGHPPRHAPKPDVVELVDGSELDAVRRPHVGRPRDHPPPRTTRLSSFPQLSLRGFCAGLRP